MSKIKSIINNVVGEVDKTGSQRYFLTVTALITSIVLYVFCIFDFALKLNVEPIYIDVLIATIILCMYFLFRFGKSIFVPKLILSVLGIILIDISWYTRYLSNGTELYLILIFGALILWVWEGRSLALFLGFYFLNLAILFLIESRAHDNITTYSLAGKRTIDVYISVAFYAALLISVLFIIKRDFQKQTNRAIQSDKLKSAFLANMSHEIRTPLNSIVGFSHLLMNNSDETAKSQYINFIHNSSDQLLNLINDIIDLSRIEAGDLEIKKSSFRISELFRELYDSFMMELSRNEQNRILLKYSVPENDLIIYSDYFRLKQVLINLVKNAIKFTSEGSVTYSCFSRDKEIIFEVADTGTGIPEEDKEKIFERFVKYNYNAMNNEGSGIGLSIVKNIINALDGRMWVESTVGKGSVFGFSIPNEQSFVKDIPVVKPESEKRSPGFSKIKSILIVEDDKSSYHLIREGLKDLNVDLHHVTNGKDAIDFVRNNPDIDLILMDFKIPYIDGYEATREIKKINPGLPVIGQSAFAMSGDKEKAVSAGCDNYLTKPLDLAKLQSLIRSYLTSRDHQY